MCWIASTLGWFSIVQKGAEGEFHIRARARRHLEKLIDAAHLDGQTIVTTRNADYAYRLILDASKLRSVFEALEKAIDYPNVKAAIGKIPGEEKYEAALHRVWAIMADALQPRRPYPTFHDRDNPATEQ